MHHRLNVVHVCTMVHGGAGNAAYRLHVGLKALGVNSSILVLYKTGSDPDVKVIPPDTQKVSSALPDNTPHTLTIWNALWERWGRIEQQYPSRPAPIEIFSDTISPLRLDLVREIQEADIVHFHWVAGMLDYSNVSEGLRSKHIVWTLHDMNPFTGGCHYAGKCIKYTVACSACPLLGSDNEQDISRYNWHKKADAYCKLNLHIVTPSMWLERCVGTSGLLSRFPRAVVPYGIPVETFMPIAKREVRRAYGLPESAKIILCGADYAASRKGFHLFTKALQHLASGTHFSDEIIVASFGPLKNNIAFPKGFRVIHFGRIQKETELARIYSLADVFVAPSIEDNLPSTVLEAMACGVPVVVFAIGGMPDMVEHKKTGYLATPYDCEDLACGIVWCLEANNNLGEACRHRVVEKYAVLIQAQHYVHYYKKNLYIGDVPSTNHRPAISSTPVLSILVPTKDRLDYLKKFLSSIPEAARGVPYEVLILYAQPDQAALELADLPEVKFFIQEDWFDSKPTWPQMMNFLLRFAQGKYFMFASDDIVVEKDSIAEAVALLEKGDKDLAGVAMAYRNTVASDITWERFGVDLTFGDQVLINYGLIKTACAREVGGFSETYSFYCADGDLCLRLISHGYRIIPSFSSQVIHNNVLDTIKQQNLTSAEKDIQTYRTTWSYLFRDTGRVRRIFPEDQPVHQAPRAQKDTQGAPSPTFLSCSDNPLEVFVRQGLWQEGKPLRLHLGCGERRLEGYINIDYPPKYHTVQVCRGADVFADITTIVLPPDTVDEVRLHHVFEHFERPDALAQLIRWHEWLKPQGKLIIETPDFKALCHDLIVQGFDSAAAPQILRHLFGSHEASWASHRDGWYEEKFKKVLSALGFVVVQCDTTQWKATRNIQVIAHKKRHLSRDELVGAAERILAESCIDGSELESRLLTVWKTMLHRAIGLPGLRNDRACTHQQHHGTPQVSLFMAVYNAERFLSKTIASLCNQTFYSFELIIVDDGSMDSSVEIARRWADRDSRITVITLPHQGEVAARNEALRRCSPSSRYLMNHDSDDISLPEKLERLVDYLEKHPEVAVVGCCAEYIDEHDNPCGKPRLETEPERIRKTFGQINSMVHSAALFRREVYEKIGGYREEYRSVDDYDFFARALMAGFVLANIPDILHRIRLHPASVSATRAARQRVLGKKIQENYQKFSMSQRCSSVPAPVTSSLSPRCTVPQLDILFTVEFYHPHLGGAELVVQHIAERLAQRCYRVGVATSKLPDRTSTEHNGVSLFEFDVAGKLATGITGEQERYQEFLRTCSAWAVVHYAAQQWATDVAFPLLTETRGRRINVLAPCGYSALKDAETLRWQEFYHYFTEVLPKVLPLYDAIVYHSRAYTDYWYGQRLNLTNGIVIPNAASEEEFDKPPEIDFRKQYGITTQYLGLCVANYVEGKGQELILSCVRKLNRDDFTMVFIGKEGNKLPVLKEAARGIPRVLFLTNIPRSHTIAAFHSADIFLFGSSIEASPLVIIEAKASRTPFVSTDCGNVREWKGGIVCPAEELYRHVAYLLDNPSDRARLAEEGWKEWREKLTWSAVTDAWENLLLKLKEKKLCKPRSYHVLPAPQFQETLSYRTVGVVIFSKDRPLQLDAVLRSFALRAQDAKQCEVAVLYTTSHSKFQRLYTRLAEEHPEVRFVRERCFQEDVVQLLRGYEYVLFLVDDALFVRDFSLKAVVEALERSPSALGFSLRLGKNTTYCYALDKNQTLPNFSAFGPGILSYDWTKAAYDFGYPLEVSSSVYRGKDIIPLLSRLAFTNPNTLEASMAQHAREYRNQMPQLLCFEQSVAFCAPMNKVQQQYDNRACTNSAYSPDQLAQLYCEGKRIDVTAYHGVIPHACHQEIELHFQEAGTPERHHPAPAGSEQQVQVSVIIPCYNQAHFLPDAVESVVGQTYQQWECIIVNDGSTDATSTVARQLIARYPDKRIRLLEKPNGGLSDARNAGIVASSGRYVVPLDADDKLSPFFLAKAVAVLEREPEVGFVYSHIQHFGARTDCYQLPEFDAQTLIYQDNIVCVCSVIRRAMWEQVGGYRIDMRTGYEDWDFWIGCVEQGWKGYRLDEPLFFYRKKEGTFLEEANKQRAYLISRIVLNHPRLYSPEYRACAEKTIHAFEHGHLDQIPSFPKVNFTIEEYVTAFTLMQKITPFAARTELGQGTGVRESSVPHPVQRRCCGSSGKRILFAFPYYLPSQGGVEEVIKNLSLRLSTRGWDITVACRPHPERSEKYICNAQIVEFDITGCSSRGYGGNPEAFVEFLKRNRFDIICSFGTSTWTSDIIGWNSDAIAAKKIWVPTGYYNIFNPTFWPLYERLPTFLSRFDAVVQLSEGYRDAALHRLFSLTHAVTIPNGVDFEAFQAASAHFREKYGIAPEQKIVLHVSNHFYNKGHRDIRAAFKQSCLNDYCLVMIGNRETYGKPECYEECLSSKDEKIHTLSNIPREDVIAAFKEADLYIHASHYECFPVVLLEAMASGTPFVSTDAGCARELAGGIVVPRSELWRGLQELARDREKHARLRLRGIKEVKEKYTWDKVIDRYETLFDDLLNERIPHVPATLSFEALKNIVVERCDAGAVEEALWYASYALKMVQGDPTLHQRINFFCQGYFPQLNLKPEDIHYARGTVAMQQQDIPTAISCYDAALACNPNHLPTIAGLRFLEQKLGVSWKKQREEKYCAAFASAGDLTQLLSAAQFHNSPRVMNHLYKILIEYPYPLPSCQANPLVSIIIPCFNDAAVLARTIHSVRRQTYTHWEIIIVDDGSQDESGELIAGYAKELPENIKMIRFEHNCGVSRTRNAGVRLSVGEYLLFLDAGDEITPNCLAEMISAACSRPPRFWFYGVTLQRGVINRLWSFEAYSLRKILTHNLQPVTSLMPRKLFEDVGGFCEHMTDGYEDWDFWLRAAQAGYAGVLIPKILFVYNKEERSRNHLLQKDAQKEYRAKLHILRNNHVFYKPLGPRETRILQRELRISADLVNEPAVREFEIRSSAGVVPVRGLRARLRVLFYFFKNVHIPIMIPIYKKLKHLHPEAEIAFGYMQYAPQIRAGFTSEELRLLHSYGETMYAVPQEFKPDITFIADSVYPWVQGCGTLVHVGHGVLSKGQYYTDTPTARREQQADLICVPGRYHETVMKKIISRPVVATGMAKLDALFSGTVTRSSVIQHYGLPEQYRYILFAPTFNDELSAIPFVEDRIAEVLPDENTVLVIKLHGSTKQEYQRMYRNLVEKDPRVIFADELDITPLLALADLMISDVSSAMMEFAALDKPLVLFNSPRWKLYQNYNPSDIEYRWRDIATQVNDIKDMAEAVRENLACPERLSAKRKEYTDQLFANKYDGRAADRIVSSALDTVRAGLLRGAA